MKLKKLVALCTAGALCLGMSLTAFAADPSREEVPESVTAGDIKLEVKPLDKQQLEDVKKDLDTILEDAGRGEIPDNAKAQLVVAADIDVPAGTDTSQGVQIEVALTDAQKNGLANGDKLYVLHFNETTKKWEVLNGWAEYKDGKLYAKVYDFSPFAFVKVTQITYDKDGKPVEKVITLSADTGKPVRVAKSTSGTVSPKTGE